MASRSSRSYGPDVREQASPPVRRTQEERRAETRGRLLEAAIRLLGEKGYSRFRIADAVAMAGVSRGGQTHYFATKNDLVEAAIEQVYDIATDTAEFQAAQNQESDVLAQAAAQTNDFLNSSVYRLSVNMLISAGADAHLADRIRTISLRSRPPIERVWIDRIIRTGVSKHRAEDVLWTLWSIQRGVVVEGLTGDETEVPEGFMDFALNLLGSHLKETASQP